MASIYEDPRYAGLSDEDKGVLTKQQLQQQYGGMGAASLNDFQTLLGRLESSKIRQQQAKDTSARPNIYAQGLAQMMSNFWSKGKQWLHKLGAIKTTLAIGRKPIHLLEQELLLLEVVAKLLVAAQVPQRTR